MSKLKKIFSLIIVASMILSITPVMAADEEIIKFTGSEIIFEAEKEPEITFKDEIDFADFEKLDLRLAYVKDCKKVEKADKLLNFTLDVGGKERTILSGIAKYYKPEDLIGKKVMIIAN